MDEQDFKAVLTIAHNEHLLMAMRIAHLYGREVAAEVYMHSQESFSGMRNGIDTYREVIDRYMQDYNMMWYAVRTVDEQDAENDAHARQAAYAAEVQDGTFDIK